MNGFSPVATLACAVASLLSMAGAIGTAAADASWSEPTAGPVNQGVPPAWSPSMISIGGVPYVAWEGWDGTNGEIRVSRLNAAGTAWEDVVGGVSPINHSSFRDGTDASLTSIGGVPYVAWSEYDGTNHEIRVSRLNAAGTAWEEVVGGPSPINHASTGPGRTPSITSANGVPYVAWQNLNSLRVSRLNAAGTAWEDVPNPNQGTALDPNMATIDGVPYVAWRQPGAGSYQVRVARLNAAGTAFEEVVGGDSPINHSSNLAAVSPSLADIEGVPHVAWTENTGTHHEIRVSRLNAAGTAWEEVVGGDSPINHASDQSGLEPSLSEIGGVPYVAWVEVFGGDFAYSQLRVSRLNAPGTAWEEVVGGDSPFGVPLSHRAQHPSLIGIGGVPYVAWDDTGPGYTDVRVSRLEPEFLSQAAFATDTEALVLSKVRTYGVAYPIAFQYGAGAGFGDQTASTSTGYDRDVDTVFQVIGGLTPETAFSWRPIGFDGWRPTGIGPTGTFTTRRTLVPTPPAPRKLLVALLPSKLATLAGRSLKVRYFATLAAKVRLDVRRGGKLMATARARARGARNSIRWDGRIAGRRPKPGRYTVVIRATSPDGQTASDRASLRVLRREIGSK